VSRYANMDHAGWLEDHLGRKFTRFQTRVVNIIGIVGGGIYNTPINWKSASFDERRVRVNWSAGNGFATFDNNDLTNLVLLAHAECIRIAITPATPSMFRVHFFPRLPTGCGMTRPPDVAHAVADFETWYKPLDRWFQEPTTREVAAQ